MRTIFKKRLDVSGDALPPIDQNAFVLTIDTQIDGGTAEMVIPTNGSGYNCTIDWGDGTVENLTDSDISTINSDVQGFEHTYSSHSVYRIQITGTFPRIYFNNKTISLKDKVIKLENWGNIAWSNMEGAFYGCVNMRTSFTDTPNTSAVTSMKEMFARCHVLNSPITNIDATNVTNMTRLFSSCYLLNKPIEFLNSGNVTTTLHMFENCRSFNSGITMDTSGVTNMKGMFFNCEIYNQPITFLNTSAATNLSSLFANCFKFNQSVSSIDTSSATTLANMFLRCAEFNQPVSTFNTANVTACNSMFAFCNNFNQSVGNFNTANVTMMESMFRECENFDGDGIDNFDLSSLGSSTALDLFALACDFTCQNYSDILIAWENDSTVNNYRTDLRPHFGISQYNTGTAATARSDLLSYGWDIFDGGVCGDPINITFSTFDDWWFEDEGYYLYSNRNVQDSAQHDLSHRGPYRDHITGDDGKGSPWYTLETFPDYNMLSLYLYVEDDNTCHLDAPDNSHSNNGGAGTNIMPSTGDFAPYRSHWGVFNDNVDHLGDPGPAQRAEAYIMIKSETAQTVKFILNGYGERADPPDSTEWIDSNIYEEMRIFVEEIPDEQNPPAMGDGPDQNANEVWVSWSRAPGGSNETGHPASCQAGVGYIVTFADYPSQHSTPETRIDQIDLKADTYYRIRIYFSTNDSWYHVGAFYQFIAQFDY